MRTETLTVQRGKTNAMSNRSNTSHTVQGFFAWGSSGSSTGKFNIDYDHRESAGVTAQLYVRRGSDVQSRDRILRSNGQEYAVIGHSMWDQDSPLTGSNFGFMLFQVESANG